MKSVLRRGKGVGGKTAKGGKKYVDKHVLVDVFKLDHCRTMSEAASGDGCIRIGAACWQSVLLTLVQQLLIQRPSTAA